MCADGRRTDAEVRGDFGIGVAEASACGDLPLTFGETWAEELFEQLLPASGRVGQIGRQG